MLWSMRRSCSTCTRGRLIPGSPGSRSAHTTRWRHYGGLERTAPRLERLLRDFRFDTVASVLNVPPASSQVVVKSFVSSTA